MSFRFPYLYFVCFFSFNVGGTPFSYSCRLPLYSTPTLSSLFCPPFLSTSVFTRYSFYCSLRPLFFFPFARFLSRVFIPSFPIRFLPFYLFSPLHRFGLSIRVLPLSKCQYVSPIWKTTPPLLFSLPGCPPTRLPPPFSPFFFPRWHFVANLSVPDVIGRFFFSTP